MFVDMAKACLPQKVKSSVYREITHFTSTKQNEKSTFTFFFMFGKDVYTPLV